MKKENKIVYDFDPESKVFRFKQEAFIDHFGDILVPAHATDLPIIEYDPETEILVFVADDYNDGNTERNKNCSWEKVRLSNAVYSEKNQRIIEVSDEEKKEFERALDVQFINEKTGYKYGGILQEVDTVIKDTVYFDNVLELFFIADKLDTTVNEIQGEFLFPDERFTLLDLDEEKAKRGGN